MIKLFHKCPICNSEVSLESGENHLTQCTAKYLSEFSSLKVTIVYCFHCGTFLDADADADVACKCGSTTRSKMYFDSVKECVEYINKQISKRQKDIIFAKWAIENLRKHLTALTR